MRSSHVHERGLAAFLIAFGIGVAGIPTASAEPADPAPVDPGTPVPLPGPGPGPGPVPAFPATDPVAMPAPVSDDANTAAVTACSQFASALDDSSTYYGDFADTIEGSARPDYADPTVSTTNVSGRTALRQAAASAMAAAGTPGLAPEISGPMRSWSLDATKLLVKMGLRGDGQTLNVTASELNDDANNAQMACAAAGTHA